jgi:hypothetical protein
MVGERDLEDESSTSANVASGDVSTPAGVSMAEERLDDLEGMLRQKSAHFKSAQSNSFLEMRRRWRWPFQQCRCNDKKSSRLQASNSRKGVFDAGR